MNATHTTAAPVDPAALPRRPSLASTLHHTWLMAGRALLKARRNPEQFVDVAIMPLLFTPMFGGVFGGAVSGGVDAYLPLFIPGVLVQTALMSCMTTGVQLREDMEKGVFDRFRALSMSRVAPLAGPVLADVVRYAIATCLTLLVGLLMGYSPGGGPLGVLAGAALVIFGAWSLAWIFTFFGTIARSAQAVQGFSMMILFPLTFLSNAFVPADTLPSGLRAFADVNPVSHLVTAVRALANEGRVTADVGWAILGCLVVVAVFAPLSTRMYKRRL